MPCARGCGARSRRTARRAPRPRRRFRAPRRPAPARLLSRRKCARCGAYACLRAETACIAGDLPLRDRERDGRIGLVRLRRALPRLGRFERVPLGPQPMGVEVLLPIGGRSARSRATRPERSSRACRSRRRPRRTPPWSAQACAVLPPQPKRRGGRAGRRVPASHGPTIRSFGEGHPDPRGRRAGGAPLRGRPGPRAGAGRGARPDALRLAEPPRRLGAQGASVGAEAADPRRGRLGRRGGARRRRRGPRARRARS